MTYAAKKYALQNNRSQVLNTQSAITLAKVAGLDEDVFNNQYLWGDGTNKGVDQIIQEYYQELNYENGATFTKPILANYTQAGWNAILKNAVDAPNDDTTNGVNSFYPSGNPGTINLTPTNLYLSTNGYTAGTAGITGQVTLIKEDLGNNVNINSLITQVNTLKSLIDTTRTDLSLIAKGINTLFTAPAMSADVTVGDTTAITTYLSSINTYLGINTDLYPTQSTLYGFYNYAIVPHIGFDSTHPVVTGVFTPPAPASFYTITLTITDATGNSHVMTPITTVDSTSTAANLVTAINAQLVIDGLNTYATASNSGTTLIVTGSYYGALQYIVVGGTTVPTYWNVSGGAGTKYGSNGPTIGPLFIANIDNIATLASNRATAIAPPSSILGTSNANGIKKWRTFWIEMRIAKPTASLIALSGDSKALTTLPAQLSQADSYLSTLIGTTWAAHQQYIPTPKALACFQNPLFNKTTGEITQMRTGFVFDGQPHAAYYFIYRQPAPTIGISNINADTQWNSTCCYDKYCTINSKTSFLDTFYTDTKTNFTTGQKWVYRVRVIDNVNLIAGDTTASTQSSLYNSSVSQVFTISSDSVIHFGTTNLFKKGNYVVINGTASSNGYYYVKDTGDTSIWLTPIIGNNTGTVYLTNSIVSV